jgi:hypothetical protein
MKVAFCVEGDSDVSVFSMLLGNILRDQIEVAATPFRRNGWQQAIEKTRAVAWHAYQAGLNGVVFAVDNDGDPIHAHSHLQTPEPRCRWCQINSRIPNDVGQLPRYGLPPLFFIIAVPVQTIEVWLLLARGDWSEAGVGVRGKNGLDRADLKRELYGVADPDLRKMNEVAVKILTAADFDDLAAKSSSFDSFRRQARQR